MSEIILLTCILLSIIMLIYYVNFVALMPITAECTFSHFSVSQIKCYWGNKYAIHISTVDNFSYNSLLILDTIFRCILIAITTYQHISFGSITGHLKNLIIPLLEYLILLKIQLSERMSLWYWRWLIINEVSN